MATVLSFYLQDGKNKLGTFELQGSMDNPFVIYEFLDIQGAQISKTYHLNPSLLQRLPPDTKMKVDYFYQGQIVFGKPADN